MNRSKVNFALSNYLFKQFLNTYVRFIKIFLKNNNFQNLILGIDDVSSECDLDDYEKWNWLISNNDNEDFDKYIETIISQINQK